MAEWFYAIGDERKGPVSEEALQKLARDGKINNDSLVWKEGMADWLPYAQVSIGSAPPTIPDEIIPGGETERCAYSGKVMPKSEMIPYGDVWIAPQHKAAFVQQMMETSEAVPGDVAYMGGMNYAGFWWRFLAYFIDSIILSVVTQVMAIPLGFVAGFSGMEDPEAMETLGIGVILATALYMIAALALYIWYETWMVGRFGATVGKMAIGAKIVTPSGEPLTYGKAFARFFGKYFVDSLAGLVALAIPLGVGAGVIFVMGGFDGGDLDPIAITILVVAGIVGVILAYFPFFMAGFDSEKRSLHDRMFSTRVIKK